MDHLTVIVGILLLVSIFNAYSLILCLRGLRLFLEMFRDKDDGGDDFDGDDDDCHPPYPPRRRCSKPHHQH